MNCGDNLLYGHSASCQSTLAGAVQLEKLLGAPRRVRLSVALTSSLTGIGRHVRAVPKVEMRPCPAVARVLCGSWALAMHSFAARRLVSLHVAFFAFCDRHWHVQSLCDSSATCAFPLYNARNFTPLCVFTSLLSCVSFAFVLRMHVESGTWRTPNYVPSALLTQPLGLTGCFSAQWQEGRDAVATMNAGSCGSSCASRPQR